MRTKKLLIPTRFFSVTKMITLILVFVSIVFLHRAHSDASASTFVDNDSGLVDTFVVNGYPQISDIWPNTSTSTNLVYLPLIQRGRPASNLPLVTKWGQRNEYTRFSPDNLRLGCWSTAIAQILYFHRLVPSGSVSYQCSTGYSISEDFDSYSFDWSLFVNSFDENTPEVSINEVARYVYFTSVAIQKDYGTGTYVLGHYERADAIAQHYNCDTALFSSAYYSMGQLKQIIIQEIDASRPVMMHMRDLSSNYHAVVIDAYREEGGKFLVHINMGWEGVSDGWYDFDSDILTYNDTSYRQIMTIRPK